MKVRNQQWLLPRGLRKEYRTPLHTQIGNTLLKPLDALSIELPNTSPIIAMINPMYPCIDIPRIVSV